MPTNFIDVHENQAPTSLVVPDEDRFPGLAELLEDILTPQLALGADPMNPEQNYGLYVERLGLDVPLEIQTLRNANNQLEMGTSFPTQWIETSVQPVLHRLRVTLELDDVIETDDQLKDLERDNADHHSGSQALES